MEREFYYWITILETKLTISVGSTTFIINLVENNAQIHFFNLKSQSLKINQ